MAVTSQLEIQAWFEESPRAWLDPGTLQSQAIALAVLGLLWIGVKNLCPTIAIVAVALAGS